MVVSECESESCSKGEPGCAGIDSGIELVSRIAYL